MRTRLARQNQSYRIDQEGRYSEGDVLGKDDRSCQAKGRQGSLLLSVSDFRPGTSCVYLEVVHRRLLLRQSFR